MRTKLCSAFVAALMFTASVQVSAQALTQLDRDRGKGMLLQIHDDLKKFYYDTTFHGIDLKSRVKQAEARIDTAKSNSEIFGVIAQMLSEFDDSHLFFIPPQRAARVRYGWEMMPIGDSVYILAVKPGSDAEKKGLRPGDRLVTVNGFEPTRANLWKLRYLYWVLRPQPVMRLGVEDASGATRMVEINSDVREEKQRYDLSMDADIHQLILDSQNELDDFEWRSAKAGNVFIWQLNTFSSVGRDLTAGMKGAKDASAVVLDLRGNSGGRGDSMLQLLGAFLDQRVLAGIARSRDGVDTLWVEPSRSPFKGRLVVLIDSRSASAAEVTARVLQLEARATVVGDWSSGHVMGSRAIGHGAGVGRIVPYGVSMTRIDLRMKDGATLEHRGVMPDEIVVPTQADLAAGRDPALARAVAIAGANISPESAGQLFPIVWKK